MTDVRLVKVKHETFYESTTIQERDCVHDNPNGTHLLVPVEWVTVTGEWLTVDDDQSHGHLTECPTCGGSGVKYPMGFPGPIGEDTSNEVNPPCEKCNGRGWVLKGGDNE
jgi:hypothetical protein